MKPVIFFLTLCFTLSAALPAQAMEEAMFQTLQKNILQLQKTVESLQSTVAAQNEVIREQSRKISAIETSAGQNRTVTTAGPSAKGPFTLAGLSQGFNPEIGVAGTVEAKLTEDSTDGEGNDTIAMKELEVSFAQYVDPFSRLDAILVFNDNLEEQNVDIEEAYYSHWGLPLGFRGQIGKFRAKIGKQNLQHLHMLNTSDYALVIRDFFGEEGLSSSGARLVHDIPTPWESPIEITGEILRGNNGNSFSGISRRPIFNLHADTTYEFSKDSNLEFGWTTLFGDENPGVISLDGDGNEVTEIREKGQGRYGVKLYGADLTYTRNLSEGRSFKSQNEVYFQRRSANRHPNNDPWGFYNLIDYKFHSRFSTGIRFDYLQPLEVADLYHGTYGVSPYITFHQSEFASFKLQFSHTEPADAGAQSNNEIFLTANFLIGSHKHPVQ